MKKFIAVMVMTLILIGSAASIVLANPMSLRAEHGLVMPASGLNLDLGTGFALHNSSSTASTPSLEAQLNYGAFPGLTVAAAIEAPMNVASSNDVQKMVKLYYSPIHDGRGYTLYLGYDLDKATIPVYGLSLWADSKLLLGYINLEARSENEGTAAVMITPGANLHIGSKLQIGGEVEVEPENWQTGEFTLGASYAVYPKVQLKMGVITGGESFIPQSYNLGLSATL